jgi:hypothetical protein
MDECSKWRVTVGDIKDTISADLLTGLGYDPPGRGDDSNTARYILNNSSFPRELAAAFSRGLRGDAAALAALAEMEEASVQSQRQPRGEGSSN